MCPFSTSTKFWRIWELLHRPVPSIQRLHDLERSLYDASKLVEKQQEEIRTLMNHPKLLEEEKIKLVSIANDDLHRQQTFTPNSYNFHHSQHTALINLLIEANHARLVAETTADRWRQRCEAEPRKHTSQSVHLSTNEGAIFD